MAATAELGRLCLSHSRAEMQLIADVALTASSPLTYTGEASTTDLSAALTAPHAWLCRGQGFHLALHISLDGYQLHGHLQRYLAHSICNADFWKQLNLQAAMTQEPSLDGDLSPTTAGILIHLTYLNQDIPLGPRHRLPTAVSIQDVQPPLGVEVVRLTSINLTLNLSRDGQKNEAKRDKRVMRLQSSPHMLDQPEDRDILAADDPRSMIAQEQAILLQGMSATAPFPIGHELLHLNPSSVILQRIDSGTASADDQISKGGAEQHELKQPILELIDSALRLAICEKPPKLPPSVKINRDDVARLATVSPALWRPNHLKPVSERAPFLPTIAHALSHSLLSNARSASLKRKATELLGSYPPATSRPGPTSPGDVQQCKGPNSVYEAASIGLWNLLQRSHFDSGAYQRLKPLMKRSSNITAKGLGEADDMLFEVSGSWQGDSHQFADHGDSDSLQHPPLDQLPGDRLLWECDGEYEEMDRHSFLEPPETPRQNDQLPSIFEENDTAEQMLLDMGDSVELGHGVASETVPEAHSLHARSRHQVSAVSEEGATEESLVYETAERIETPVPADAHDRSLADPEMLFDEDL